MRNLDLRVAVRRNTGEGLIAATLGTLTGDRRIRPVKQRRLCRIFVPPGVAVVGLGTLVTALVAQSVFIRPSKISVPAEEISCNAKFWCAKSVHASHAVHEG